MAYIRKIALVYPSRWERVKNPSFDLDNCIQVWNTVALYFQVDHKDDFIGVYTDKDKFDQDGDIFYGQTKDAKIRFTYKEGSNPKYLGYGVGTNSITEYLNIINDNTITDVLTIDKKQLATEWAIASANQGNIYQNDIAPYFGHCVPVEGLSTRFRLPLTDDPLKFLNMDLDNLDGGYIDTWYYNDDSELQPIFTTKYMKIAPRVDNIIDCYKNYLGEMRRMGYDSSNTTHTQTHVIASPLFFYDIDTQVDLTNYSQDDAQNYADTGVPQKGDEDDDNNDVVDDDGNNPDNAKNVYGTTDNLKDPNGLILDTDASNFYDIDTNRISQLLDFFWNEYWTGSITDAKELFTGLYQDLSQNVASLRCFLIRPNLTTVVSPVQLGKKTTTVEARRVIEQHPRQAIGEFSYSKIKNDLHNGSNNKDKWLNYAPYTTAKVYLPYYGLVDVNMNKFIQFGKIKIYVEVDIISGTATYYIFYVKGGTEKLDSMYETQIAIDVPLALYDSLDVAKKQLDVALGMASAIPSVATNPVGSAFGLLPSLSTQVNDDTVLHGTNGTTSKIYSPNEVQLIIETTNADYTMAYAKRVGYPCNKSHTLNQLKGYTICKNPQLRKSDGSSIFTTDHTPTKREQEIILSTLEKGVIL